MPGTRRQLRSSTRLLPPNKRGTCGGGVPPSPVPDLLLKEAPTDAFPDRWLSAYAKLVVGATIFLIFVGGHTTTSGAGMAFADWPLSDGSLNPDGWWGNLMQRLEHGHRLTAETVGLLIGILCAWVWRARWALPAAAVGSVAAVSVARLAGLPRPVVAHLGLWSSAAIFAAVLLWGSRGGRARGGLAAHVRWLAFAAFAGVCAQAVMGGFRVTLETGGSVGAATVLRVFHGCFAQFELCLLVAIATLVSPEWGRRGWLPEWRVVGRWGWVAAGTVYLQLAVGASMRHLGAGLAIPSFPAAGPGGSWWPAVSAPLVHLNFTHTRVGAVCVSVVLLVVAVKVLGSQVGPAVRRPLACVLLFLAAQWVLGVLVVWKLRPLLPTTAHVVNGALLLSATVWMSLRAWAGSGGPGAGEGAR